MTNKVAQSVAKPTARLTPSSVEDEATLSIVLEQMLTTAKRWFFQGVQWCQTAKNGPV